MLALLDAMRAEPQNLSSPAAMADAVKTALSKAISDSAPPKPNFSNFEDRIQYLNWLSEMSNRLKRRIPDFQTRTELLEAILDYQRRDRRFGGIGSSQPDSHPEISTEEATPVPVK